MQGTWMQPGFPASQSMHLRSPLTSRWAVTAAARNRELDCMLQRLYLDSRRPHHIEDLAGHHHSTPVPTTTVSHSEAAQRPSHLPTTPSAAAASQVSPDGSVWALGSQELKNPRRLDFETMYQQLVAWQMTHLSCHVPRNCHDAPPLLDAWVRHLRRLHASGALEQWKVDRLNLLGFEWSISDQHAKWLSKYHELRRYRAVHGHVGLQQSQINSQSEGGITSGNIGSNNPALQHWLQRQAVLYAKGALTEQQVTLLASLGVELRVAADKAERAVQEQGLNAHERRRFRQAHSRARRQMQAAKEQPRRLVLQKPKQ